MRRFILSLFGFALQLLFMASIVLVVALVWLQTPMGSQWALQRALPYAEAATGYRITATGLQPGWPFHVQLAELSVADAQGPFLTLEKLDMKWSPLALQQNSLHISRLKAQRVTWLRPPEDVAAEEGATASAPVLPLQLDVRAIEIAQLHLPPTLAPTAPELQVVAQLTGTDRAPVLKVETLAAPTLAVVLKGEVSLRYMQELHAKLDIALGDLSQTGAAFAVPLQGQGTATLELAGPLDALQAKLTAQLHDVGYAPYSTEQLEIGAEAALQKGAVSGQLNVTAQQQALQLALQTGFGWRDNTLDLQALRLTFPAGQAHGQLTYATQSQLVQGQLNVMADNLHALSAFVPFAMAGAARVQLVATAQNGQQSGHGQLQLENFSLNNSPVVKALSLKLQPRNRMQGAEWQLSLAGQQPYAYSLQAAGWAEMQKGAITSLTGQANGNKLALARAVEILRQPDGLKLTPLKLQLADAQAELQAEWAGERVSAAASWANVTPALLAKMGLNVPPLGAMAGNFTVGGTVAAPVIKGEASFAPQIPRPGQVRASYAYSDARLSLNATYSQGAQPLLHADAVLQAPLQLNGVNVAALLQAPITARAKGQLPLGLLMQSGLKPGNMPSGQLALDVQAKGPLQNPELKGTASLSEGQYRDAATGLQLKNLQAQLLFDRQNITLRNLQADDGQGGTLTATGHAALSDLRHIPVDVQLNTARLRTLRLPEAQVTTSAQLSLQGSWPNQLTLSGPVTVHEALYAIPDKLPVNLIELPLVQVGGPVRQPLLKAEPDAPAVPVIVNLQLDVNMPGRVRVEGRGLISELKGDLQVRGTSASPSILGQIELVRGSYSFLGKSFTLSSGHIAFDGDKLSNPTLDIDAQQASNGVTTIVHIDGPVSKPEVTYESDPALPKDEIISRLLFGQSVAQLSPVQAVQLATAVASLVGGGTGFDPTAKLRDGLGLDQLGIVSNGATMGENALQMGKYISDDVFVSIEQGLTPESRKVGVEMRLSPQLSVEGQVGAESGTGLNLKLQRDY